MNLKTSPGAALVGFSIVLPPGWEHFRIADRPELELSTRLRSYLSRGANANLIRRLRANLLSSVRSMRESGTTDMYLPYVKSDSEVPIPASMIVTPMIAPKGDPLGIVEALGGSAEHVAEDMNSGTHYIFPGERSDDLSGVGSANAGIITSVVQVPDSSPVSALVFQFSILEPDLLGEDMVADLQRLFLVMLHSVKWEY